MKMLTEEQKKEIYSVLDKTSRHRGPLPPYPQEVQDFIKLSDKETVTRRADGFDYKIYVFTAHNKSENCPIHLNIHGGGFVGPHRDNDEFWSSMIADRIQGIVLDIDYTLSGEAAFPVAMDQCVDAYQYALEKAEEWHADADRISVGGYSAGGLLTADVCLKAAEMGIKEPCLQVIGYAPIDYVINPKYKKDGYIRFLALEREKAFQDLYFGGEDIGSNFYNSPLYAPDELLMKQPRTLICTAETCNFRFEDEEYAGVLANHGVEVTFKRFPGTNHGFIPHFAKGWEDAAEVIVRMIRQN